VATKVATKVSTRRVLSDGLQAAVPEFWFLSYAQARTSEEKAFANGYAPGLDFKCCSTISLT
jgi:hypothetical protein